jgi:Sulfatase-modifying factor enzyme 1
LARTLAKVHDRAKAAAQLYCGSSAPTDMAGKIFINYRRGDDPGNTGRLFDRLQEAFQPDPLFMDIDNIAPGLDFLRVIEEQVDQCDARGLFNVHGNVWDWTNDCWHESNQGNPGNGSARTTGDCSRRVVRGGSWISNPQYLRAAVRDRGSTGFRVNGIGFRLARTLSP